MHKKGLMNQRLNDWNKKSKWVSDWIKYRQWQWRNHQSSSAPVWTTCGWSLAYSPLFASYYYFFKASCCDLMVSMSLAMNKSIIKSHGLSKGSWPLNLITSLANIQKTVAMAFGTLLLHGITISTKSNGASVLHKAIVGMLTYEASTTACLSLFGSATIKSLGSWNFFVNWLVKVPGIHLDDELAVVPVYWPNL